MGHPTQRSKSRWSAMPENQGGHPQRIWDACLLMAFRNRATLNVAVELFEKTTGHSPELLRAKLQRLPLPSQMAKLEDISTDYFLRLHLRTIHERAFKNSPDFDGNLIGKMQAWNYTTRPVPSEDVSVAEANAVIDRRDNASRSV